MTKGESLPEANEDIGMFTTARVRVVVTEGVAASMSTGSAAGRRVFETIGVAFGVIRSWPISGETER
jgi:hypothetical protein